MKKRTKHWTEKSTEAFLYRIGSDFALQLEAFMGMQEVTKANLAERLGVSKGRVSQVLNNPGNLTLRKVIEYARVLGVKVAIVAYDDDDPGNHRGPINSKLFVECWKRCGQPRDQFDLVETRATNSYSLLGQQSVSPACPLQEPTEGVTRGFSYYPSSTMQRRVTASTSDAYCLG